MGKNLGREDKKVIGKIKTGKGQEKNKKKAENKKKYKTANRRSE